MYEVIRVDGSVTSLTALRSAMYRMSGEFSLICRRDGDSYVVESTVEIGENAIRDLLRHINDYQLREIVSRQTAVMRDAILGAALLRLAESGDES
ncbi:MAG: hypothetical protein EBX92_07390 [Actinobacteria bacterium]|jgi:His-Xaa-Ser system protein HxsD|nr:hypothetical protein [Actinomycetota bacterium]